MKEAAAVIEKYIQEIVDTWEKEVNQEITASKHTPPLVLRNLLPIMLGNIAQILREINSREELPDHEKLKAIINNSIEHGRHRATSPEYTIKQVTEEYMILHRVLARVLLSKGVYNIEVGLTIMYTLEKSMAYSLHAFSNSIQEMRETLMGTLAHDMRNPIAAAYVAIDILKYQDGEERFNKLKNISLRSLRKSMDLMEGLLDAITVKAGEGITLNFSETEIVEEIKWVFNDAREIYTNEIQLKCDKEEIWGIFDGTAVRRVLENLVTNAVKYGTKEKPITISVYDQQDTVTLKVHNCGNPIKPEDQEQIFHFLSRNMDLASGRMESWGMGLTLVKIAAEAHGGYVDLKSDEEHGTTFSVILNKTANKPGKVRTKLKTMDKV